jgi:hypothetical protein
MKREIPAHITNQATKNRLLEIDKLLDVDLKRRAKIKAFGGKPSDKEVAETIRINKKIQTLEKEWTELTAAAPKAAKEKPKAAAKPTKKAKKKS